MKIYGVWALLVVLVNLAAGVVPGLGDWYIRHVFPIWVNTYGRFMDIFPFSVGEWMLALGVAVVCSAGAGIGAAGPGSGSAGRKKPQCRYISHMPPLDKALLYFFCLDAALCMYRYDAELFSAVSSQYFFGTVLSQCQKNTYIG